MKKIWNSPRMRSMLCLMALLGLSGIVVYWKFLFGNYYFVFDDIGGDTSQQYIWQYYSIVEHLKNGDFSFWDFTNGLGTNMFQYNLFNPALMLVYALGYFKGPDHMVIYLVYIQILQILAAGAAGYLFLSHFQISEKSKVLGAYLYGMNGFLLVWGQHYQFGMASVYLPLVLVMAERSFRAGKAKAGLPVMVCLMVFSSTYFSYMSCLAVGVYLLFRAAYEEGDWKQKIWVLVRIYAGMLLGIAMGLCVLLPSLYAIIGLSGRTETGLPLWRRLLNGFLPLKPSYYLTLLYRFFSANLQNVQSTDWWGYANYYEAPNVFTSIISVIFGCQFLGCLNRAGLTKRQKGVFRGAAAAVAFILLFPLAGIVCNAFSGYMSRFTFVLLPFFCLMTAWVGDFFLKGGKAGRAWLVLDLVLILALYGSGAFLTGDPERKRLIFGMALVGILAVVCVFYLAKKENSALRRKLYGAIMMLAVCDMCLEGLGTVSERDMYTKGDNAYLAEVYNDNVLNAIAWIKEQDPEFYRVEKTYMEKVVCMSALAQEYYGVSTYNSTQNGNVRRFVQMVRPEMFYQDVNHYRYCQAADDEKLDRFLGVRYLLTRGEQPEGYEYLCSFEDVDVYKCKEEVSAGRFYSKSQVISEDTFTMNTYNSDGGRNLTQIDDMLLNCLALENPEKEESSSEGKDLEKQTGTGQVSLTETGYGVLTGTAEAETDGYVLVSIPYEKGWSVKVDGEEQKTIRGNIGFTVVAMEKGTHTLELVYQVPYFKEGIFASACAWALYFFWFGFQRFGKKRSRK